MNNQTSGALTGAGSGAAAGTAIMPGWGTAIGAVAGGLLGFLSAEDNHALDMLHEQMARLDALNVPDVTKEIMFKQYIQGQNLSAPVLAQLQEELVNPELVQDSVESKKGLQNSIAALQQYISGNSPQMQMEMEQAKLQAAQDAQAKAKQIQQSAQARGQGQGAGDTLAAQLIASQGAAQNQGMQNLQAAANASNARLGALNQMSGLQNNMRNTDIDLNSRNAQIKNQRQAQLMENAQNRAIQNANMNVASQQFNINNANAARNANTQQYNQEQLRRNYEAPMQMFNMQLAKATGQGGLTGQMASLAQNQSNARAQQWQNMFGNVATAYANNHGNNGGGSSNFTPYNFNGSSNGYWGNNPYGG